MTRLALITLLMLVHGVSLACPVCEKQQPEILRGVTHGTGPDSRWDYVIVWIAVILVLITLFYSIKWLIRPGENASGHIKQFILND